MRFGRHAELPPAVAGADSDMHDVKALGMLGLDGAAILGLTAARGSLPRLWWVAVIALAVCVPFFLFTIIDRSFSFGPAIPAFYKKHVGSESAQAGVQLLSELTEGMAGTRRLMAVKGVAFTLGLVCFIGGSLFAATFLVRNSLIG